jgi:transcriptional regulator with XRE-family HTH domain
MKLMLKQFREAHGLTQRELAESIGTTLRKISSWENNEVRIPLADAARIADVFDCSLDELAGRDFHRETQGLSPAEDDLVSAFRASDERGKGNILDMAQREKSASQSDVVHVGEGA